MKIGGYSGSFGGGTCVATKNTKTSEIKAREILFFSTFFQRVTVESQRKLYSHYKASQQVKAPGLLHNWLPVCCCIVLCVCKVMPHDWLIIKGMQCRRKKIIREKETKSRMIMMKVWRWRLYYNLARGPI